jgi:hypothetical protein
MLSDRYSLEMLEKNLISRDAWHPFPTIEERDAWEALPASVRKAHIVRGEAALDYAWPALPATLFLEYARVGNRSRYQAARYARRWTLRDLVVAECMEGQGRFLDDIVNGIWTTCEESYWGVPAHLSAQRAGHGLPDVEEPTVDLFAAETAGLLAWTHYLLGERLDTVSPLVLPRIQYEVDWRVLTPCFERDDFWWMGFTRRRVNNWNPWVNSNWLTSALLLEEDKARRVETVAKSLRSLDVFINGYTPDGGCDEGPGYWGRAAASLFDCLELLRRATDGAVDVYDEPLIQNMGRFIYRVHIHDHYFVNFADASAIVHPDASLVFRYGQQIGDEAMAGFGAWLAAAEKIAEEGFSNSLPRQLPALFTVDELLAAEPRQPMPRDAWLEGIQVMTARDQQGTAEGLYLAAKGGHNAESHNHNDVGNFIVYKDGRPVIIDAGVETYRAQTFSARRYEIWTMQSAYHNLPTVNGVMQAAGEVFAACDVAYTMDDAKAQLTLDIAGAYPEEAGLKTWRRTITLNRGKDVQIVDQYEASGVPETLTLSLLTPCNVVTAQPGKLVLEEAHLVGTRASGAAEVEYDADTFTVTTESVEIEDERLKPVWGDTLTRIMLAAINPSRKDNLIVRIL